MTFESFSIGFGLLMPASTAWFLCQDQLGWSVEPIRGMLRMEAHAYGRSAGCGVSLNNRACDQLESEIVSNAF
jgi:hypothetical protein